MLTVNGIYDGGNIHLFEMIDKEKKYKVLVTFIEEVLDEEQWNATYPHLADDSFSFWEDSIAS
jgi:hypothetical protein